MNLNSASVAWLTGARTQVLQLAQRGVHAVLLHGAAGCGKKRLALDLAALLLCEDPAKTKADTACGVCAGCHLSKSGNHPDLRIVVPDALAELMGAVSASDDDEAVEAEAVSAESSKTESGKKASADIRIEQVRALANFGGLASHRGGVRLIVLAPAERLNGPAANALLKMLEEPAPNTLFLLVSDALDDVLPTIRSRCVLVRTAAPTWADALHWLQAQGVDDAETRLAQAGGAPIAALQPDAAGSLEPALRDALLALLAAGARLTSGEIAAAVPRTVPLPAAITLFQRWGWDLLALRTAGRVRYHRRQESALRSIVSSASALDTSRLLLWLAELNKARAAATHPLNPRLVIENLLIAYQHALAVKPV